MRPARLWRLAPVRPMSRPTPGRSQPCRTRPTARRRSLCRCSQEQTPRCCSSPRRQACPPPPLATPGWSRAACQKADTPAQPETTSRMCWERRPRSTRRIAAPSSSRSAGSSPDTRSLYSCHSPRRGRTAMRGLDRRGSSPSLAGSASRRWRSPPARSRRWPRTCRRRPVRRAPSPPGIGIARPPRPPVPTAESQ